MPVSLPNPFGAPSSGSPDNHDYWSVLDLTGIGTGTIGAITATVNGKATVTATLLKRGSIAPATIQGRALVSAVLQLVAAPAPPSPPQTSSASGPLPWLTVCGVEVANAARTVEYLRNGLGNTKQGHWELGVGGPCSVLYRTNGFGGGLPNVYSSPRTDPAPWYDASQPGSQDFLGILMTDIVGYDSVITRPYEQRPGAWGGAVFAGQSRKPREWKFRATLVSASDAGAEYGLRWLTQQLQSGNEDCSPCYIRVRLTCPPANGSHDEYGYWTSFETVLTDGPHPTASNATYMSDCRDAVEVEWTMVAANPYLYTPRVGVGSVGFSEFNACNTFCEWLDGPPGLPITFQVTRPSMGTIGALWTLKADSNGMGPLKLETWDHLPAATETSPRTLVFSGIPPNGTVTVDSSLREISVTLADGTVVDGANLLDVSAGGVQWQDIAWNEPYRFFSIRRAYFCTWGHVDAQLEYRVREG